MITFKQKVFAIVKKIPAGKALSYGEVAKRAGNRKAARAVGAILKTSYNSAIPCHRVVRADGTLGGYNRGVISKQKKLLEEGYKKVNAKRHA